MRLVRSRVDVQRLKFSGGPPIHTLGIDVGTSGTRAVVIDSQGRIVASATRAHVPFTSPGPAWAEQDPADWWRAACEAVRDVLGQNVPADAINGIGVSGQMHGAVLLGASNEVLRPSIIWCDQRTAAECEWLNAEVGAARLLELTSNPALTNFTLTKLLWVRRHEPEVWRRIERVLLPKDYVRLMLSGVHATDVADASGTLLLDVARRRWSLELLEAVQIDIDVLPAVHESADICAHVSLEGATATGLRAGTPIVAGAGDQAAGAVGMGITRPGTVSVTIGTSGVVFAATERPALDRLGRIHTFCHAVPDRWHVMGVTQAAGLSLRWARDQLFRDCGGDDRAYARMTEEARHVPAGAGGVLWAPYLMGERTPHCDPDVRAAFVGLAASHTRAHLARAILEGVAFSLRDSFGIFSSLDVPIMRVRVGGGGARSPLWREIQASVLGRAVESLAAEEGAAYGAAILAGVGAGVWPSVDDACDRIVKIAGVTSPRADDVNVLDARYAEYTRLYPALQTIARRTG
jgi:xylulokinase